MVINFVDLHPIRIGRKLQVSYYYSFYSCNHRPDRTPFSAARNDTFVRRRSIGTIEYRAAVDGLSSGILTKNLRRCQEKPDKQREQ